MGINTRAYKMAHQPIVLKELTIDCDITQGDLAAAMDVSRPIINLVLNRCYMPSDNPEQFMKSVEEHILGQPRAVRWLTDRDLDVKAIWSPAGSDKRRMPCGHGGRIAAGKLRPIFASGDPEAIGITTEVEMVQQETLKHFHIFRNPFIDDIQKESDIYMSDEHRYIEMAMKDAAEHGGFLAVIGECGSGKSVMRRKVVEDLKKEGDVRIIFPQIIDKGRINAASICDAIIMDLSEQRPKLRLEAKTRQVHKLLLERSKEGFRSVLIIEEAHDLNVSTLKYLKRFYELEDGYRKLLGIILVGQVELRELLDEGIHVEMREVIRRIQVAEIKGLNGNIRDYLTLKFKRVGAKLDDVFTADAIQAISDRLTKLDRQNRKLSHAYPLVVNNIAARAMNRAYDLGEEKVTREVVEHI
jgi:type II secretory pathway predicted ATPase ExeA